MPAPELLLAKIPKRITIIGFAINRSIIVSGKPLLPLIPDGHNWGWDGNGAPLFTALAILMLYLTEDEAIELVYFLRDHFIAKLTSDSFKVSFSIQAFFGNMDNREKIEKATKEPYVMKYTKSDAPPVAQNISVIGYKGSTLLQ